MDPTLVSKLNDINREFYSRFASPFAGSRSLAQTSLHRLVMLVPPRGRVLDVGCGHGRVASLLERGRPDATYLGLDFCLDLIELARNESANFKRVTAEFMVADILQQGWSQVLEGCSFDIILVLAVLHHIPDRENRSRILRTLRNHLSPEGHLILSAWQFTTNPRMRRKIVSWELVGVDTAGLETGDYLLDWKRGGVGYRYCHLIDHQELLDLAVESDLNLLETFRADGKEGDLSLFGVLAC